MRCSNYSAMSWNNPSPAEAAEAYAYYEKKYYDAAREKNALARQEETYRSQKGSAVRQMNELSSKKINFEKRLEGIIKIIGMLEGSASWFGTNVPNAISKAVSSIQKSDSSYRGSIILTGGVSAASLETAFRVKSVDEDPRSASALNAYKSEKVHLEQEIANLKSQIAAVSAQIDSLNRQIQSCSAEQSALRHTMNTSAYEMNHYRKRMY